MAFPGKASGVGSGVKNVTQKTSADVLDRKQVIVGTFDPLKTTVVAEVPVLVTSPADTGDKFGFGSMLHRLHLKNELGAQGIETWIQPQAELGGATAAAGEIDFTGSTGVLAGTLPLYIAGDPTPVAITAAMSVEDISNAVIAAVNANVNTNVIATQTAVTFEVILTSKTKATFGNDVDISFTLGAGEAIPTGIATSITQMTGGASLPSMADALDGLGTEDDANQAHFTALIHGYGQDTTVLNAISTYVGEGNEFNGLYAKTVARPFRSLTGDTVLGSAGLAAQIAISDTRLQDRSQGVICVPDSQSHPAEIAAQTLGHCERVNDVLGQGDYVNIQLIGVQPGASANRWTKNYDDRNTAVTSGVGTTLVVGGKVLIQDVVSYYRPASVPEDNNGYRDFANISISQNILNSQFVFFSDEKHQNLILVVDVARVTDPEVKKKVRDVNTMTDFVVELVRNWEAIGWIADGDYTVNLLKQGGYVTIRTGGDGFTITIPTIYSGKGKITDVVTEFDVSFAAIQ